MPPRRFVCGGSAKRRPRSPAASSCPICLPDRRTPVYPSLPISSRESINSAADSRPLSRGVRHWGLASQDLKANGIGVRCRLEVSWNALTGKNVPVMPTTKDKTCLFRGVVRVRRDCPPYTGRRQLMPGPKFGSTAQAPNAGAPTPWWRLFPLRGALSGSIDS